MQKNVDPSSFWININEEDFANDLLLEEINANFATKAVGQYFSYLKIKFLQKNA